MLIQMEVETSDPRFFSEECTEFEKIVKLIQSTRVDAAELIFEELKKSIKKKGRWLHEDRIWPHQNGQSEREKNKRKLKIIDNQELYTRFIPAGTEDENKPPVKETKVKDKFDEIFDLTKEESPQKTEKDNKRLTISNRNEIKQEINNKDPIKENKKINKTESIKNKEENGKIEKTKNEETNGKSDKSFEDDVELLLSLSNSDQDNVEPKILRKRKEVKKENSSLHKVSNGGIQKKKSSSSASVVPKSTKGNEPLFNLKENMKQHDGDIDSKMRQKMFYGSTQVTRRDKPRREGTLADDSKKRLEAKLKKVKAKLKKSI